METPELIKNNINKFKFEYDEQTQWYLWDTNLCTLQIREHKNKYIICLVSKTKGLRLKDKVKTYTLGLADAQALLNSIKVG